MIRKIVLCLMVMCFVVVAGEKMGSSNVSYKIKIHPSLCNDDPFAKQNLKEYYELFPQKEPLRCFLHWKSPERNRWEVTIGITKVIKIFGKNGAICEVFGHWWEYDNEIIMAGMTPYYQLIRKCKLCGKNEFEKITWEKR